MGLRDEEIKECGALSLGEDSWTLLDSGSMVHACRPSDAWDVPVVKDGTSKLQSVTGSTLQWHGRRQVPLVLGGSDGIQCSVGFDVSNVAYPLLSLGKVLKSGADFHMDGAKGYLEYKQTGQCVPVEVRNNVLMVRTGRQPRSASPGQGMEV